VDGKGPGTISLILWGNENRRVQYDVVVDAGASNLQQQLQMVFPGEDIRVAVSEDAIVLSGHTTTSEIALRAAEIAQASSTKAKVVNLLQGGPAGSNSQQVMLEVRFAEVSRTALVALGASLLSNQSRFSARSSTQQFNAPFIDESQAAAIQVPDFLNLFFFLKGDGLIALKALQQRGDFQMLAEPNLIAYNGQEASFLAGGEFPIPIVSGIAGQVSVQFKEFGVRLSFTPKIMGELVRLKVRPEVSTIDESIGITLNGFHIPALKTRRAETEVELRDSQSFAIAGLLDNSTLDDHQSIPYLSKLPIVGRLFKSKQDNAERTELLVMITPHLVRPLEASELPPLPVDPKRFLQPAAGPGSSFDGGGGFVDAPTVGSQPQGPR
jgi:pilus assembly protein CpaC